MGLLSIAEKESKYFDDKKGFIELESCPIGEMICTEHLLLINKNLSKSRTYWVNKDYLHAIEELKIAYYTTTEINQASCQQCATLFRSVITKSMTAIHEDLQYMTTGIFKATRFKSSFELATNVLNEFNAGC